MKDQSLQSESENKLSIVDIKYGDLMKYPLLKAV
jgi:hypothetical protein